MFCYYLSDGIPKKRGTSGVLRLRDLRIELFSGVNELKFVGFLRRNGKEEEGGMYI